MRYKAVYRNDEGREYEHEHEPTDHIQSIHSHSILSPIFDDIIYNLNWNMRGSFKLISLTLME